MLMVGVMQGRKPTKEGSQGRKEGNHEIKEEWTENKKEGEKIGRKQARKARREGVRSNKGVRIEGRKYHIISYQAITTYSSFSIYTLC